MQYSFGPGPIFLRAQFVHRTVPKRAAYARHPVKIALRVEDHPRGRRDTVPGTSEAVDQFESRLLLREALTPESRTTYNQQPDHSGYRAPHVASPFCAIADSTRGRALYSSPEGQSRHHQGPRDNRSRSSLSYWGPGAVVGEEADQDTAVV